MTSQNAICINIQVVAPYVNMKKFAEEFKSGGQTANFRKRGEEMHRINKHCGAR